MLSEEYFNLVNWFEIKRNKNRNRIFEVNITSNARQYHDITDEFNKDDLMMVKGFFKYNIHDITNTGSVTEHIIVDKYVDECGNLILFTQVKSRQVSR